MKRALARQATIAIVLLTTVLAGCAGSGVSRSVDGLQPLALDGGAYLSARQAIAANPGVQARELDPELLALVRSRIDPVDSPEQKVAEISRIIISPEYLGIRYDSDVTGTAQDVYRTGVANCLGFSHLFIAMAREVNLDAHYQQVEIKPSWQRRGDWLVVGLHVNVSGDVNPSRTYTADIDTGSRYRMLGKYTISDETAMAQHYNNLAMDALLEDQLATAFGYMARAIDSDPGLAYVWTNLGTLYKRNGQYEAALGSYEQALALDRTFAPAMQHLATVYKVTGNPDMAGRYSRRLYAYQKNNPYYYAQKAAAAAESGEYARASRAIAQAIALKGDEFDFYVAAYQYEAARGNAQAAAKALEGAGATATGKQKQVLAELTQE